MMSPVGMDAISEEDNGDEQHKESARQDVASEDNKQDINKAEYVIDHAAREQVKKLRQAYASRKDKSKSMQMVSSDDSHLMPHAKKLQDRFFGGMPTSNKAIANLVVKPTAVASNPLSSPTDVSQSTGGSKVHVTKEKPNVEK